MYMTWVCVCACVYTWVCGRACLYVYDKGALVCVCGCMWLCMIVCTCILCMCVYYVCACTWPHTVYVCMYSIVYAIATINDVVIVKKVCKRQCVH